MCDLTLISAAKRCKPTVSEIPARAAFPQVRLPGAEKIPGRLHDLPQHHWQAQIPGYQRIRAQQPAQLALRGQHVTGPVDQLHQQLIQFQQRHVREIRPASRARASRHLRDGRRRTWPICVGGARRCVDSRAHQLSHRGRHLGGPTSPLQPLSAWSTVTATSTPSRRHPSSSSA
jgi:hypothetical protein